MIKEILDQIADNVSNFFVFSCNMTYNKIHYTIAPMLLFYCLPVKYRYCTEYICYQTSHFTVQPTPYSKFQMCYASVTQEYAYLENNIKLLWWVIFFHLCSRDPYSFMLRNVNQLWGQDYDVIKKGVQRPCFKEIHWIYVPCMRSIEVFSGTCSQILGFSSLYQQVEFRFHIHRIGTRDLQRYYTWKI